MLGMWNAHSNVILLSYHHCSQEIMTTTNHPTGNWSAQQDNELGNLIRTNQVNYRNRSANYLFEVTERFFPAFISSGQNGRNSANQRMHQKFIRYEQDLELQGARGRGDKNFAHCGISALLFSKVFL
jgi:hypothetical protein